MGADRANPPNWAFTPDVITAVLRGITGVVPVDVTTIQEHEALVHFEEEVLVDDMMAKLMELTDWMGIQNAMVGCFVPSLAQLA